MSKIYINPEEDLFEILEQILKGVESDVEVMIDTNNVVLANTLNLKYLETESEKAGKKIIFIPKDDKGKEIISNFYKQSLDVSGTLNTGEKIEEVSKKSSRFVQGDILQHDSETFNPDVKKKETKVSNVPRLSAKKSQLMFKIITIVLLLLIPVGLFIVWWFLPIADVVLTLKSDSLDQSFTLKVSPDVKQPDIKAGVFPAQLLSTQKLIKQTAKATGNKTVGERAKGIVAISNKTSEEKTFPQGTLIELISEDSLKTIQFTTTESVTITGSNGNSVVKADVSIVASDIGEDYNLTTDRLFSVGGLDSDDVVAKNNADITGGVSKLVTVITQDDQNKLLASVKSALESQVKDDLLKKAEGKNLAQNSIKITLVDKIFSDNIGAETSSFSLELTEKAEGLVIDENTIKKLEQDIKPNIPAGFKLLNDKGVFKFDVIDSTTAPQIVIQYSAKIGKIVSEDELKNNLVGKSIEQAQKILKQVSSTSEYSIRITPKLPPVLTRMPRLVNRINLTIKYK